MIGYFAFHALFGKFQICQFEIAYDQLKHLPHHFYTVYALHHQTHHQVAQAQEDGGQEQAHHQENLEAQDIMNHQDVSIQSNYLEIN